MAAGKKTTHREDLSVRAAKPTTLRLHVDDNVAVALSDLTVGTVLDYPNTTARTAIPRGHKVANTSIASNEPVRKYGQLIGRAGKPIAAGEHVHTHNLVMTSPAGDHAKTTISENTNHAIPDSVVTFIAGAIIVFATLISEMSVTILLYSAKWKTISIAIFELVIADELLEASAIGSVAIILTLALVFLASRLLGKSMAELFR